MTTDRNYSTEDGSLNYYSVQGYSDLGNRKPMSPSSWDDSDEEEELTDTNSTLDSGDVKQTKFYDSSATNEALEEEEDRRQSSARVRRREKDSTERSLALPESSTGDSFIAWDDPDADSAIFDIEIYLNERNFSQSFPKAPGRIFRESGSSNATNNDRSNKISEKTKNICCPNHKLSRIVEVDEFISNLSLGSIDNSCSVTATGHDGSRSNTNLTCVQEFGTDDVEQITQSHGEKKGDDVEILTEDRERKNRITSTTSNNFDGVCYRDGTEYFDNTLIYFFEAREPMDNMEKTRSCNFEEGGLYSRGQISRDYLESTAKIERNELFQSFREVNSVGGRNDSGDKISIDKVEDVSNCTETTHESGTPKRHGNLTGREKDHALSKESLELGLGNPFSVTRPTSSVPSTLNNNHDTLLSASYHLIPKNECLLEDLSLAHTDADTFSKFLPRSDDSSPKSPVLTRITNPKGTSDIPEISSGDCIENDDSKGEVFFKFLRKYPSDSRSVLGNVADRRKHLDEIEERSIRSHNKTKSSFENNVILELDVSDKSSSTTETKIYGDSFSEMGSSVTSESTKNNGKGPSSIIHKFPTTGKSSPTRSDATDEASIPNRNRTPPSKRDRLGFGDFGIAEWNAVKNTGASKDYPQDRGDMKFESYSVKSEWGQLIVQLDERCRIDGPVKSVYRVDVRENSKSGKAEYHPGENAKPFRSFVEFGKKSGKGGAWKITKAKKRKRSIAFVEDEYVTGITPNLRHNADRVIEKNRLVNTLTPKRRVVRRGTGSLKNFLLVRGRGQNDKKRSYKRRGAASHLVDGGINCFRTLFKRLVNFFTVFCHKNRN